MDKQLTSLTRIDWSDLENTRRVCERALDDLTAPGAMSELLANVAADPRLLDLSETPYWGDRIVLFDDPASGVRVRLHRFNELFDHPHSHRWGFTTRVLSGGYTQWLYGPESWFQDAVRRNHAIPAPGIARQETAGSSYTIDDTMVHNVRVAAGTMSVIVRGPSVKAEAIRVKRDDARITWQVGRDQESPTEVVEKRAPKERIFQLLELAQRRGLA
jgi:hypothetical protein